MDLKMNNFKIIGAFVSQTPKPNRRFVKALRLAHPSGGVVSVGSVGAVNPPYPYAMDLKIGFF